MIRNALNQLGEEYFFNGCEDAARLLRNKTHFPGLRISEYDFVKECETCKGKSELFTQQKLALNIALTLF